jgi:hypothetical protein
MYFGVFSFLLYFCSNYESRVIKIVKFSKLYSTMSENSGILELEICKSTL